MERENKDLDNFTDYVIKSEGTEGANHIILQHNTASDADTHGMGCPDSLP